MYLFTAATRRARNASRVSVSVVWVLGRVQVTPPQRLLEHFDWTPACRSPNRLPNHMARPPLQAITPTRPFLCIRPLAGRRSNTYPLPIPLHITMSPAATLCISSGSSLSGSEQISCASVDLDRRSTLDQCEKIHTPRFSYFFSYFLE